MAETKVKFDIAPFYKTVNPRVKKFWSKSRNLVLIRESTTERVDIQGNIHTTPGKRIEFVQGAYSTTDAEEVAFLRNHRRFNSTANGGFIELDASLAPPDPAELLAAVTDLAISGELKTLKAIRDKEDETFKRSAVLGTVNAAIARLEADQLEVKREAMAKARAVAEKKRGKKDDGEIPAETKDEPEDSEPEKEVAVAASGNDV